MNIFKYLLVMLMVLLLLAACGKGNGDEKGQAEQQVQTLAERAAALDQGPRAAASMELDESLAARGEILFEEKICSDCHTLGETDIAPDLLGVMDRRTHAWLTMQITQPEWMGQNDTITKQLIVDFDMEMADLEVPETEVEPILHFLLREGRAAAR